jgi:hypothetical protein
MSFSLAELVMGKTNGKTMLNMKEALQEEYIVLGEPLFKKYLVVFDYNNNRVGVGQKRPKSETELINVVSLVRFICMVFASGNCTLIQDAYLFCATCPFRAVSMP